LLVECIPYKHDTKVLVLGKGGNPGMGEFGKITETGERMEGLPEKGEYREILLPATVDNSWRADRYNLITNDEAVTRPRRS